MALVAVTAAACSSGSSSTPAGGGGSISPAASAVAGASATASPGPEGHLGAPIDLMDGNGNNLTVTLVKVFDPATVASDQAGAALAANSRWVGVELTVVDRDAAEPGQTLRVDGIGSDGKQINPDATAYGIGSYPECTPTQGFSACRPAVHHVRGVHGAHRGHGDRHRIHRVRKQRRRRPGHLDGAVTSGGQRLELGKDVLMRSSCDRLAPG